MRVAKCRHRAPPFFCSNCSRGRYSMKHMFLEKHTASMFLIATDRSNCFEVISIVNFLAATVMRINDARTHLAMLSCVVVQVLFLKAWFPSLCVAAFHAELDAVDREACPQSEQYARLLSVRRGLGESISQLHLRHKFLDISCLEHIHRRSHFRFLWVLMKAQQCLTTTTMLKFDAFYIIRNHCFY